MIDYAFKDLYYQDSVDKQLKIEVEDGTVITNEDIFSESMKLTESLCSDTNLSFGSCEASKFEIKIANQFYTMKGMWLTVSEVLNGNEDDPFVFGKYKVESDRPTADRSFREIVAYDALYDIINADATEVADWYESLLPEYESTVTLKEFRDSFFDFFGIEQEEVELPNDDMVIEKTISSASLTGKEVVTAICEINGCFGHIGRDNKFHYIFLHEISDSSVAYAFAVDDGVFLIDAADEKGIGAPYTSDAVEGTEIEKDNWQSIDYEDYMTHTISSLQIRDNSTDAGYSYDLGEGGNNYIVDGNFLLYGKGSIELHDIAKNMYDSISSVSYRPTDATLRGNPCFEVGDPIKLDSKYQVIYTYILRRTLSGIQALKDNYVSDGDETYSNSYNSISYEIEQLRGITNTFERQVESNTLKIESVEGQVSTIEQNLSSISLNLTGGLGGLASIVMKVGDESFTGDIDLSDVREAFANEDSSIEIKAGTIAFAGNTLVIDSDNFKLTSDGQATFKGEVTATSFYVYDKITIYNSNRGTEAYITTYYSSESYGITLGESGNTISVPGRIAVGEDIFSSGEMATDSTVYAREGITSRGQIIVNSTVSESIYFQMTASSGAAMIGVMQSWSFRHISLHIGTGGDNRGIWDNEVGSWIVYRNVDGTVVTTSLMQTESVLSNDDISTLSAPNFRDPEHEMINHVQAYTYMKEGKEHIGLAVDEVEESMKEAGMNPDDYDLTDHWKNDDGEEVGGICYDEFIPLLITEIQNLNTKVEELENKLA